MRKKHLKALVRDIGSVPGGIERGRGNALLQY